MKYKLKELGEIITGNTPSKKISNAYNGEMLFLTPRDMNGSRSIVTTERTLSSEGVKALKSRICLPPSISVSCIGSDMGKVVLNFNPVITNQQINTISNIKEDIVDINYLFYVLKTKRDYLHAISSGSTMPIVNKAKFEDIVIDLPNIEIQNKVGHFLYLLEQKIEINNVMIEKLENINCELFKRWFIDFEFPNDQGLPYRSSGGEMVESELGKIPLGWDVGIFIDIYNNFDSKRKPLSKLEREKREKIYPYYGAASLMDYVDDFLFDGIYLLLGEDGTVTTENGNPVLQYVWGKFWVNNHAHVIKGANGFSTEYIYNLMKNTVVTDIVTGAVQAKISQKNLNNIKVVKPTLEILEKFEKIISRNYELIRNLHDENQNLINLRDTLLPKLLSGEIEIPDESVVKSS